MNGLLRRSHLLRDLSPVTSSHMQTFLRTNSRRTAWQSLCSLAHEMPPPSPLSLSRATCLGKETSAAPRAETDCLGARASECDNDGKAEENPAIGTRARTIARHPRNTISPAQWSIEFLIRCWIMRKRGARQWRFLRSRSSISSR